MEQDIRNYLHRQTTRPLMTIRYHDSHVTGRIYCIDTPVATLYKFTISHQVMGRSYSVPVELERYTDTEIVEKYKKKGWRWSFVHPYNGYEIDCLEKEEPFKELPKGDNLVGEVYGELLIGRDAIEEYLRDNFRGFSPVTVYRIPKNLL